MTEREFLLNAHVTYQSCTMHEGTVYAGDVGVILRSPSAILDSANGISTRMAFNNDGSDIALIIEEGLTLTVENEALTPQNTNPNTEHDPTIYKVF
jgi:hypothetical protein